MQLDARHGNVPGMLNREKIISLLDAHMERTGKTLRGVAGDADVNYDTLYTFYKGKKTRNLSADILEKILPVINSSVENTHKVRLVGYVGAGAEVTFFPDEQYLDEVDPPIAMANGAKYKALRVKGDSQEPLLPEGSLLFFLDEDIREHPCSKLLGALCVVKIKDGPLLLKFLRRGYTEGKFNLQSTNARLMEDQELEWCVEVQDMRRARS